MTKKRTEIYQFMNKKLGKELIEELISYCEAHNYDHGNLWGLQQPSKFLSDMVYLMLYKDFKNIGYCAVEEELDFSYKITHNSLQHNIQVIRLRLSDWAENQFHLGNLDEWKHTAADCGLKSKVKNANLWVDSTDFRTTGRSTMSKKSSW